MKYIRNFSIIAHVNHGKSTLSDRFIQMCGGLNEREMKSQVLDSMDLERERGITIKSQSVTLNYVSKNGERYKLNLIDTPGHVDFTHEVFRSLSACEGALLVIDASQGIEAQTVANYQIAMEMNLKVLVILNKVDLLTANIEQMSRTIHNVIGTNIKDIILCSSKTGFGVSKILECLIDNVPPPQGDPNAPLQVLIIDSWFNKYLGVVSLICVKNGVIHKGDMLKSMSTEKIFVVEQIGIFTPKQIECALLHCGEVGWLVYASKHIASAEVGDTLTAVADPAKVALPKFKKVQHCVYSGLFPVGSTTHKFFSDALYKLSLNDASLHYEPENSEYLGLGFRCGFLGLLHMDIIQERLKREYSVDLVATAPEVAYEILTIGNKILSVDNAAKFLSIPNIKEIREPIALCSFVFPKIYLGRIIELCTKKRGVQISLNYKKDQVSLIYELPMSEIILDFFDNIKSISRGYASFEYEFKRFQVSDVVCLEILINGKRINELAMITHRTLVRRKGYALINRLQLLIPRQQFDISIQAAIGNRIICRNTVKQLRKNVTHKCYGGDITRKNKLLYNQKMGKKRMKQLGNVSLTRGAFLSLLSRND
ncbi:GTP-binding protein LepA [Candidatus Blochmanniella vafra str. BVAF]|uniref:Elongation factor 4 n=1 Tax=Blochmanniella vafra (strain BVAF) TaxID=859654 RepID=E8Q6F7_BLOVB|nr:translation elongation factor 4 [Candidatus Blochmannia vafer]ADV33926.1 GTP-binding protein LepA [Candidatus Blochmannia vafer str. BVAF]